MDVKTASLRDLAALLRAGSPSISSLEGLVHSAMGSLAEVKKNLSAGDPNLAMAKATQVNLQCLTIDGRSTILRLACEASQRFNDEHSSRKTTWEDFAQLPEVDQEFKSRIAASLEDLSARLSPPVETSLPSRVKKDKPRGRPGRRKTVERDKELSEKFDKSDLSMRKFAHEQKMIESTCRSAVKRGKSAQDGAKKHRGTQ